MDLFDRERLSDREGEAVFAVLFPQGLVGEDVLAEIAPAEWERSPLLAVFHPSVAQVYREAVRLHRNVESLFPARAERLPRPEPTLQEVRETWHDPPVDRQREPRELVARCLWDVFSDNHDVVTPDGRLADIGSWRGAGRFLAELLNQEVGAREYDYLDFYMGTAFVSDRADLMPVYTMIFRRLAAHGYDWEYVFPRLSLVEFDDPVKAPDPAEEIERDRKQVELNELVEGAYREALEDAKDRPPPRTVEAYRRVYGAFPRGWPPWE